MWLQPYLEDVPLAADHQAARGLFVPLPGPADGASSTGRHVCMVVLAVAMPGVEACQRGEDRKRQCFPRLGPASRGGFHVPTARALRWHYRQAPSSTSEPLSFLSPRVSARHQTTPRIARPCPHEALFRPGLAGRAGNDRSRVSRLVRHGLPLWPCRCHRALPAELTVSRFDYPTRWTKVSSLAGWRGL